MKLKKKICSATLESIGWMDGWMDGWISGWMDGQIDEQMEAQMDGKAQDELIELPYQEDFQVHSQNEFPLLMGSYRSYCRSPVKQGLSISLDTLSLLLS